ncbi:EAL domain-containing protein, partial [bacterium]|nr:EAL domain-containing protein [bacterium]
MTFRDIPPARPSRTLPEILEALPVPVCAFRVRDLVCEPLFMNGDCLEMLEAASFDEVVAHCGGNLLNIVRPGDVASAERSLRRLVDAAGARVSFEHHVVTMRGRQRLVRTLSRAVRDEDGSLVVVDVALRADARGDVGSDALDPIAGTMPMHAFFQVMRERREETSAEAHGTGLAVLYLDVVNFRSVNVAGGMVAGDAFLRSVGEGLRALFPACPVSRFEVDHFAALVRADDLASKARSVREMVLRLAPKGVDASVGACVWDDRALTPESVCDRAKVACDDNRTHVNAFFSVYTDEMGRRLANAEYAVSHIDEAIQRGWIRVFYQPIVRSCSGGLCGMEALARWDDPTKGMLSPADFVGPLEESQQIWKLDLFVIEQVTARIAERCRQGMTELPVSVNLSRIDFLCRDIFEEVESLVKRRAVPRRLLRIEVTESAIASQGSQGEVISRTLARFRAAGYEVWMDDFGSGLSSLNLLKGHAFDTLKLDMAFMRDETSRSRAIVASVVAMGRGIGIHTLAEGVETQEQADFLRKTGCEMMQGFHFGKPLPFDESLRACLSRGILIEDEKRKVFYDAASRVSFDTDTALVLFDFAGGAFRVLQMNEAASRMISRIGAHDPQEFERAVNEWNSSSGRAPDEVVRYAVQTGGAGEHVISLLGKELLFRFRVLKQVDGHSLVAVRYYDVSGRLAEIADLSLATSSILQFYQSVFRLDLRRRTIQSLRFGSNISGDEDLGVMALCDGDGRPAGLLPDVLDADEARYRAFLDPVTLCERLAGARGEVLRDIFRVADGNGGYRWTEHMLTFEQGSDRTRAIYGIRHVDVQDIAEELDVARAVARAGGFGLSRGLGDVLWDSLLPHLPLMLFWKDGQRRFLGANRAFLDYFGLDSVDQIVGRTDEDMAWHPIEAHYRDSEREVLDEGATLRDLPGMCVRRGENTRILATKWPVYRNGEVCGLMGYFREDPSGRAGEAQEIEANVGEAQGIEVRAAVPASSGPAAGMRVVERFIEDLLAYAAGYDLTRAPFSLIRVRVPEVAEVAATCGADVSERLGAACERAVLAAVGNGGTATRLGTGTFWVLCRYRSRTEAWEVGERIRGGIEAIRRVGDFDLSPSADVAIACEEELTSLRERLEELLFGKGAADGAVWGSEGVGDREVLRDLIDTVPFGCYVLDQGRTIRYWSRGAERLLGFSAEEMVGVKCTDTPLGCASADDARSAIDCCPALFALATGRAKTMRMVMSAKGGKEVVVSNTLVPIRDGSGRIYALASFLVPHACEGADRDLVRQIYQIATTDPVTQLPGRSYMEECLDEALELYRRTGQRFAVLFADVDNFHDVNNTFGHHAGDEILRSFGRTLLSQGRRTDEFCRWGGDEFVGILQLRRDSDVTGAARRLMRAAREISISEGGRTVTCHVSIGMTVIREGDDLETVVDRADRYMYEAKRRKGDGIVTDFTAGG